MTTETDSWLELRKVLTILNNNFLGESIMKNMNSQALSDMNLQSLDMNEELNINGGTKGDAAELIGRSWVWSMAHILTGGVSTVYLVAHNM